MSAESITLYYREGSSDKVYKAGIFESNNGYQVNVAYGRRGSTFQTGSKTNTPVPFDTAKKIYDKLVKEKTAKGYTPGVDGTPYTQTENTQRSTGILPQLLNPVDESQLERLFDDPAFWMQEKKDGKRVIIQVNEKITGINRKGLVIDLPQSIVNSAAEIGLNCTLDGECIGEKYYAFDLLELDGVNYRAYSYRKRNEILVALIKTGVGNIELVTVGRSAAEKRVYFKKLTAANAEGVVFKHIDAEYTSGRPASGGPQLKYKFVTTSTFIVVGVNAGKRSVGLEALNATGQRQYVGNVTIPPNHKVPIKGSLVEIRYLYAFKEGCLFQPVYLGVRDDLDTSACTTSQLKYKPEEEEDDSE